MNELSDAEKDRLNDYFVRIRYNDRPVTVPGCRPPGKHLEGDESFCTLASPSLLACIGGLTDQARSGGFQDHSGQVYTDELESRV